RRGHVLSRYPQLQKTCKSSAGLRRRRSPTVRAMAEQTPQGIFVVHLRSDSDVGRHRLVGRVEHLKSGHDEPFDSVEDLLAFMERHVASEGSHPDENAKRGRAR